MIIKQDIWDTLHLDIPETLILSYSNNLSDNDLIVTYNDGTGMDDLIVTYGEE